jgi:hypothetical protein
MNQNSIPMTNISIMFIPPFELAHVFGSQNSAVRVQPLQSQSRWL